MEREPSLRHNEFKPMSRTAEVWGQSLMTTHRVNPETQNGVLGFGRIAADPDAIAIFVTPERDLSDKEIFPDSLEGERVVYERLPIPVY